MKTNMNNNINTVEVIIYNIAIAPYSWEILRKRILQFCINSKILLLKFAILFKIT